jgi:hypothetical protein
MGKDALLISDDAKAVNFREIRLGGIAPKTLFRSSHPIKDFGQEKTISLLAAENRISAALNLCDTNSAVKLKTFFAPWYDRLYKSGRVIALGMDFSITSERFKRKLKKGLQLIIQTEGPWLVHCHAGVDRTGFVCMVLESFMGAKLDEVVRDYLLSFNSIFTSSVYTSEKADAHVAVQILSVMSESQMITEQNLQGVAEIYLRTKIGLSAEEVEILRKKLGGV